ncbi:MAG: hypothetical protein E7173_03355 [Firmicutes bacterium]|nr:hypothetical protein [Bacillota bacterium]
MKDRILIILGGLIAIIVVVIMVLAVNNNKEELANAQKLDLNNNSLSNITIDNGLLLENSKVECSGEICIITITATNNTTSNIDMSGYRISFLDRNNEEIYWYSGQSIGNVLSNSQVNFSLEIPENLKNVKTIVYNKSL